ncbi:MAG: T9SS type B sorting domain-containing protein [Chitinophagales bacterium]
MCRAISFILFAMYCFTPCVVAQNNFTSEGTSFHFAYLQNRTLLTGDVSDFYHNDITLWVYISNTSQTETAHIELNFSGGNSLLSYINNQAHVTSLGNNQFSIDPGKVGEFELKPTAFTSYSRQERDVRNIQLMFNGYCQNKVIEVLSIPNANTNEIPLSVYAESRQAYSRDQSLILPDKSLGTNYIVSTHYSDGLLDGMNRAHGGSNPPWGNKGGPCEIGIAAIEDNTEIEFRVPTHAYTNNNNGIVNSNVGMMPGNYTGNLTLYSNCFGSNSNNFSIGSTYTFLLNKGESLQIQGDSIDLSGTEVRSVNGKKIAVFGGSMASAIPGDSIHVNGQGNWDHLYEQIYPVESWGCTYISTPFQNAASTDYFKIVAREADTEIEINGEYLVSQSTGNNINLNKGEYVILGYNPSQTSGIPGSAEIVELPLSSFNLSAIKTPMYIRGTNPISVTQFSASLNPNNTNSQIGPSMLYLSALDQMISNTTAAIMPHANNNNGKQDFLTIITISDGTSNNGILLNNAPLNGTWNSVPGTNYEFIQVDVTNSTTQAQYHDIDDTKTEPGFIATIYGHAFAEAYSYNAGVITYPFITYHDSTVCIGDTLQLHARSGISWLWQQINGNDYLSCDTCQSPFIAPDSNATYVVHTFDSINCDRIDTVDVFVEPCCNIDPEISAFDSTYCLGDTVIRVFTGGAFAHLSLNGTVFDTVAMPHVYEVPVASLSADSFELCAIVFNADTSCSDTVCTNFYVSAFASDSLIVEATDANCQGSDDGTLSIVVSGGSAPYFYQGDTLLVDTLLLTDLSPGIYSDTIMDAFGCPAFFSDSISEPDPQLLWLDAMDISCFGAQDGMASAEFINATGTVVYEWTGGLVGDTISGLDAGTYSVTATDQNGCTFIDSIEISEPDPDTISVDVIDAPCFGEDGSATVNPSFGNPPYSYLWSDSSTDPSVSLPAGDYSVTVTDSSGCGQLGLFSINEPDELTFTSLSTNIECFGDSNGAINIFVNGGTTPYTYQWDSNSVVGSNPTNLTSGIYNFSITDSNGCEVFGSDTISEPDSSLIVLTFSTDATCHGSNDGTLSIVVSGGSAPYFYQGDTLLVDTLLLTDLSPGIYSDTIMDAFGCPAFFSDSISEPDPQLLWLDAMDISCFGAQDGMASAEFINATGTVVYEWTSGLVGDTISDLDAGTYSVTATDQNGCTFIDSIEISEPVPDTILVDVIDASCFGEDGSATVNPTFGNPPYTYLWSDSSTAPSVNIPAGDYSVTVLDSSGCGQLGVFSISEPGEIIIAAQLNDVNCIDDSSGNIILSVIGGNGSPYSFTWNPNVSANDTASSLAAEDYSVTVSDQNGCETDSSFSLNEAQPLELTATTTDLLCYEDSSGSIVANVPAGTPPYDFTVTDNGLDFVHDPNGHFNSLAAGTYDLAVLDSNGCTDTISVVIGQPAPLSSLFEIQNAPCKGQAQGQIIISNDGGTPAYTFELSSGASNNNGIFSNLSAGDYSLSITDANGCLLTDSFTINEPDTGFSISVSPEYDTLKTGETIVLQTSVNQDGIFTYSWEPAGDLSCDDCPAPEFTALNSTEFTVVVLNEDSCYDVGTAVLIVEPYNIFIPNAFTPNGDGENDFWELFGDLEGIKYFRVLLFDRWGEKIFESNDPNFQWDGTYKGELLPPDVFAWRFSMVFKDGRSDKWHGSLTLIR